MFDIYLGDINLTVSLWFGLGHLGHSEACTEKVERGLFSISKYCDIIIQKYLIWRVLWHYSMI